MARKLDKVPAKKSASRNSAAAKKAAAEAQVLRPQLDVPLAGETVIVKEYDFWTSMDIIYGEPAFLHAAVDLLSTDDRDPWEAIRSLFGKHRDYLKRAAAVAVGRDVAWVESLGPRDTDTLMSAWWAVNGHFFLHEATVVIRGRVAKSRLAGPTSSSPSPPPASATSIASAGTPSAN